MRSRCLTASRTSNRSARATAAVDHDGPRASLSASTVLSAPASASGSPAGTMSPGARALQHLRHAADTGADGGDAGGQRLDQRDRQSLEPRADSTKMSNAASRSVASSRDPASSDRVLQAGLADPLPQLLPRAARFRRSPAARREVAAAALANAWISVWWSFFGVRLPTVPRTGTSSGSPEAARAFARASGPARTASKSIPWCTTSSRDDRRTGTGTGGDRSRRPPG